MPAPTRVARTPLPIFRGPRRVPACTQPPKGSHMIRRRPAFAFRVRGQVRGYLSQGLSCDLDGADPIGAAPSRSKQVAVALPVEGLQTTDSVPQAGTESFAARTERTRASLVCHLRDQKSLIRRRAGLLEEFGQGLRQRSGPG